MSNTVYVINSDSRNELLKRGFKLIGEQKAINGETVWILHSDDFKFDIDSERLPGVIESDSFRLNF